MIRSWLVILIVLTCSLVKAGNHNNEAASARTGAINGNDTVYFDLSKAVTNGDFVQFPVYISSVDTVYTLDFSFKFNHNNLLYDSIINQTIQLKVDSHYNPAD